MGVGVFSDTFGSTGSTINVSGPLGGDYDKYLAAIAAEHPQVLIEQVGDGWWNFRHQDTPLNDTTREIGDHLTKEEAMVAAFESFDIDFLSEQEKDREQYNDENTHLIETIEAAGKDLGISVSSRNGYRADTAVFDKDFTSILESKFFSVGWRSWEHDFVVGIGGKQEGEYADILQSPEESPIQVIENTGRSPRAFDKLYQETVNDVHHYLVAKLQSEGIECSFKTSGYTSKEYPKPEDFDQHLSKLKDEIQEKLKALDVSPQAAFIAQGREERVETMRSLSMLSAEEQSWNKTVTISTPVYDHVTGSILFVDPLSGEVNGSTPGGKNDVGVDLAVLLEGHDEVDGLTALPRNEATEAWFVANQKKMDPLGRGTFRMIAAADEFVDATNDDLIVKYDRFAAESQNVFQQGVRLADGLGTRVSPEELREQSQSLVAQIERFHDEQSELFKAGFQAVLTLIEKDPSQEVRADLGKIIRKAESAPEDLTLRKELVLVGKPPLSYRIS